jgi:hypothetical protein
LAALRGTHSHGVATPVPPSEDRVTRGCIANESLNGAPRDSLNKNSSNR